MSPAEVIARALEGPVTVRMGPPGSMALRQSAAILAALDAAGLAVVPKEPTVEMLRAAFVRDMGPHECRIYRAMVAAAKEGE
jgi:hypothetical protein